MNRFVSRISIFQFGLVLFLNAAPSQTFNNTRKDSPAHIQVDGMIQGPIFEGIGVNANTRSWNKDELKPAIQLLMDSMHATIWRVIVETVENWEVVNDNEDPFRFNWDYYHKLYETPKFQKAWDMIRYLNEQGVTDKLMINFMGIVPQWMGGEKIKPDQEDEYIELLLSFFIYAKKTKHLRFGLVSLMNEPDIRKEGPTVGPEQYARLFKKLITRMKEAGLGDIRFVAPDVAGMDKGIKGYLPLLLEDPEIMKGIAHFGLHSYGGYYAPVDSFLKASAHPQTDYWMTEWNAWCKGCDDGILGEYNYHFAATCMRYLFDLLKNGATAALVWEGYDSYYEHHAPSPFSYWGMLAYDSIHRSYHPRKNFYAIQQVSKFVSPGSRVVSSKSNEDSLDLITFFDSAGNKLSIIGINQKNTDLEVNVSLDHLPAINHLNLYYTNEQSDLSQEPLASVNGNQFKLTLPANCLFTLSGTINEKTIPLKPEPPDWYAGDIHVHRNCGNDSVLPENKLSEMMEPNNLAVISVLADMGNGEVKYSQADLMKVNGSDAPQSTNHRIIHWDAEWHWDATYSQFSNQALGGHLVLLGLKNARQIWEESPYKILEWGKIQQAVVGFAHFQYLNDRIQDTLNCCIPIDYPVEAALGSIDFISEDVYAQISPNNGLYNSEAAIDAYYKLLNCGFRMGLAAGTDYPCNNNEPLGTLLTYAKVDGRLTYEDWIRAIKDGKTVVSRNGHKEFLELKINDRFIPGDEIKSDKEIPLNISLKWKGMEALKGRVELVSNGKLFFSQEGSLLPGDSLVFTSKQSISKSSWICARRMDEKGHALHTAPIYIKINNKPVRANAKDARFFIEWIDNILKQTAPGNPWNRYFSSSASTIRNRYLRAKSVYEQILKECESQ